MIENYIEPTFYDFVKGNLGTVVVGGITVLGIFASMYFGFETWKVAEREKFEKRQQDQEIQRNTEEINAKAQTINLKTAEIEQLNQEIRLLQGEGLQKMEHQISILTGGDSFPLITLANDGLETPYIYSASLWVRGNYPLRNLSIRISITQAGNTNNFPTIGPIETIRQMTPTNVGDGPMIDLRRGHDARILIRFIANNGTWVQTIQFRKNDNDEYEYKMTLRADQQPDLPPLIETDFGEGIPVGSFSNLHSTRYRDTRSQD
jgi:hypothetical protein